MVNKGIQISQMRIFRIWKILKSWIFKSDIFWPIFWSILVSFYALIDQKVEKWSFLEKNHVYIPYLPFFSDP